MLLRDTISGDLRIRYRDPGFRIWVGELGADGHALAGGLPHWHRDIQLVRCVSGGVRFQVEQAEIDLEPGELLFINRDQLHRFVSARSEGIYQLLVFDPELLGDTVSPDSPAGEMLSNPAFRFHRWSAESFAGMTLTQLIEKLHRQDTQGQTVNRLEAYSLISQVLVHAFQAYEQAKPLFYSAHEERNQDILRSMIAYMAARVREKIALDEVAAAGDVSRSKCCKLFADGTEHSPMEYLSFFRLEYAANLLVGTKLPLDRLTLFAGFSEQSYFTRLFRVRYGLTPGRYRRRFANRRPAAPVGPEADG
jgi:AraC-like DNA-binding protein